MVGTTNQPSEHGRHAIDESDVVLTDIRLGGKRYSTDPPLYFAVEFDPSHQVYQLIGDFGMFFSETGRYSLLRGIKDVLKMFRTEIAMEHDDDKFTKSAKALRNEMRQRLRIESNI